MLLKRPNRKKAIININEMLLKTSFFSYFFNEGSEVDINNESNSTRKTL